MERQSLGQRLRQARLDNGIDLAAIADESKIGQRYLEAIENGNWDILPSPLFAKSFARQYAECVGIPPGSIETDLTAIFPPEPVPTVPVSPADKHIEVKPVPEVVGAIPRADNRLSAAVFSLVAVVALCSFAYVGWQKLPVAGNDGEFTAVVEPEASAPAALNPVNEPLAASPTEDAVVREAIPVPTSPDQEASMTIEVLASETTWLSISANGKSVFRGILEPNEGRSLEGVERARIIVGNAGGIQVRTNGKNIGPLGPSGQVRVLLLTPDGSQVFRQSTEQNDGEPQSRI
jgi:cytoskeleton protein RodZ